MKAAQCSMASAIAPTPVQQALTAYEAARNQGTYPAFDFSANSPRCKAFIKDSRWPAGVRCPRCQNEKVYTLKQPWKWQCQSATCGKKGYRFGVLTGTIFENTKYPLRIWFEVGYLICQSKKGISALQIHRQIGSGDYRTAWFMCHRIRYAMAREP